MSPTQFVTFNNCLKVGFCYRMFVSSGFETRIEAQVYYYWFRFLASFFHGSCLVTFCHCQCCQVCRVLCRFWSDWGVIYDVITGLSVCLVGGYCYAQTTTATKISSSPSPLSGKFIIAAILSLGCILPYPSPVPRHHYTSQVSHHTASQECCQCVSVRFTPSRCCCCIAARKHPYGRVPLCYFVSWFIALSLFGCMQPNVVVIAQ